MQKPKKTEQQIQLELFDVLEIEETFYDGICSE